MSDSDCRVEPVSVCYDEFPERYNYEHAGTLLLRRDRPMPEWVSINGIEYEKKREW